METKLDQFFTSIKTANFAISASSITFNNPDVLHFFIHISQSFNLLAFGSRSPAAFQTVLLGGQKKHFYLRDNPFLLFLTHHLLLAPWLSPVDMQLMSHSLCNLPIHVREWCSVKAHVSFLNFWLAKCVEWVLEQCYSCCEEGKTLDFRGLFRHLESKIFTSSQN